jgi:hypothetical protein
LRLVSAGGDIESSVSISFLHLHTHFNKQKKIAPVIRVVVVTRRFVTYGIREGLTSGLGFAIASIDMIRFDYTIVDRVDCVRTGNHG